MKKKTCRVCGKTFYTEYGQKLYCSKECGDIAHNEQKKERRERDRNLANRKLSLDEINRQARAAGMSYGKFVAEMYKERLRNERTMQ